MANRLRPLAGLLLALLLALTSVTMAVSRTEAGVGQLVSVCADGEVHLMRVGADGKPLAHDHSCPYCVLTGVLVPDPVRGERGWVMARALVLPVPALPVRAGCVPGGERARGPPAAA